MVHNQSSGWQDPLVSCFPTYQYRVTSSPTASDHAWGAIFFRLPIHFQGPELRKGLDLYRVVNNTGLQVREGIELGSSPCGRIPSGDVFCVNHSSKIQHGNRYLTRLHIVEPRAGWVSGVSKWVEKFQDGRKPGPVPLKSTLDQKSIVLMKPEGWSVPGSISKDMARRNGLRSQLSSRLQKTSKACSTRSRWLHSRYCLHLLSAKWSGLIFLGHWWGFYWAPKLTIDIPAKFIGLTLMYEWPSTI